MELKGSGKVVKDCYDWRSKREIFQTTSRYPFNVIIKLYIFSKPAECPNYLQSRAIGGMQLRKANLFYTAGGKASLLPGVTLLSTCQKKQPRTTHRYTNHLLRLLHSLFPLCLHRIERFFSLSPHCSIKLQCRIKHADVNESTQEACPNQNHFACLSVGVFLLYRIIKDKLDLFILLFCNSLFLCSSYDII